jgi:hypothetical protein
MNKKVTYGVNEYLGSFSFINCFVDVVFTSAFGSVLHAVDVNTLSLILRHVIFMGLHFTPV